MMIKFIKQAIKNSQESAQASNLIASLFKPNKKDKKVKVKLTLNQLCLLTTCAKLGIEDVDELIYIHDVYRKAMRFPSW